MKLIILDRDGVINEDIGDYVKSAEEWQPIAGSIEAIARLSRAGFTVVVATNQSGLARGQFDLDDLEAMHAKLTALVEEHGGKLEAIFYCPHHPDDGCKCRKPKTGMLDAIEAEFNTSVQDACLVGDRLKDLQAGLSKGARLCLVRTGRGQITEAALTSELSPEECARITVFDNLQAVADHELSATQETHHEG